MLHIPALDPQDHFITIFPSRKSAAWTAFASSAERNIIRLRKFKVSTPDLSLPNGGISESKFNLRQQIVFTNMATLFPSIAPVHTNYPVKTILITQPPLENQFICARQKTFDYV
jgi:hypothetical protein